MTVLTWCRGAPFRGISREFNSNLPRNELQITTNNNRTSHQFRHPNNLILRLFRGLHLVVVVIHPSNEYVHFRFVGSYFCLFGDNYVGLCLVKVYKSCAKYSSSTYKLPRYRTFPGRLGLFWYFSVHRWLLIACKKHEIFLSSTYKAC